MPNPRFYFPAKLQANNKFELPANLTHYAMRVLRLADGAQLILFDGTGGQYPATLEIHGKKFFANTKQLQDVECELKGQISLFHGIASGDKMDWIIEKAVELGVHSFFPLTTQRSVIKLSDNRLNKRIAHWQSVAQSASEQSGRNRLMLINKPMSLQQALDIPSKLKLFCHPAGTIDLRQSLDLKTTELQIFIGPEGGWSDTELSVAEKHQISAIRFGKRVLRTETAGIAITAAVSTLLNW